MPQQAAAVGIPILSAVAATKTMQLAGIHLALGVNVVVTLASVLLAWLRLRPCGRMSVNPGRRSVLGEGERPRAQGLLTQPFGCYTVATVRLLLVGRRHGFS